MNSASCKGTPGVSDTFASALWALDALFNMASVGVDGVNFHMLPGSAYELFTVSQDGAGNWQAAAATRTGATTRCSDGSRSGSDAIAASSTTRPRSIGTARPTTVGSRGSAAGSSVTAR